jgi:hypothetical protein
VHEVGCRGNGGSDSLGHATECRDAILILHCTQIPTRRRQQSFLVVNAFVGLLLFIHLIGVPLQLSVHRNPRSTSQLTTSVMLHNNEASSSGIGTTEDE